MLDNLIAVFIFSQYNQLVGSVQQLAPNQIMQEVGRYAFDYLLNHSTTQRVHTERVHVSTDLVQEFAQLVHGGGHGLLVLWPFLLQAMHVVCEPFLNDPLDDMVAVLVLDQLVQFVSGPVQYGFGEGVA